jgi:hypothetical protein
MAVAKTQPDSTIEMSPENAIIVLLNDRNGRTLQEMARTPGLRGYTYDEVIGAAKRLEIEGKVTSTVVRNETIYSLRSTCGRTGKNLMVVSPTLLLDAAIWDVMSDRKARLLQEVADDLKNVGFHNKTLVMDRVIDLRKKKWFAVSGFSKKTTYTLMKHIQRPVIPVPDVQVEEVILSDAAVNAGYFQHAEQTSLKLAPIEDQRTEEEPEAMNDEEEEVHQRRQAMTPAPGDSLDLAIWKVMSDHTPATVRDIEALLDGTEHTFKTISPRMSVLYARGWFHRIDDRKAFVYTLKEDIRMPASNAVAVQKDGTKPVDYDEPAAKPTEQPPAEPMTFNGLPKPLVDANAPLVEVYVRLRGVEISKDDADNLVKKLNSVNLEEPKIDDDELLSIETKIRIKGQEFTMKEAAQVFNYLNNRGFG